MNVSYPTNIPSSNHPPTILITAPSNGQTFTTNSITIQWTASDPDGDALTFSVDCDNDGTYEAAGITTTSYTCSYSSPGTYTARVVANDGRGGTASDTVTFTIASSPSGASDTTPPVINSFTANPPTIQETNSTTLQCVASDNNSLARIEIYKNYYDKTPAKECNVSGTSASCSATVTYYYAGTHTAKCIAIDAVGNEANATTTVNVTSSGGTGQNLINVSITSPSDGSTFDTNTLPYSVSVSWTASSAETTLSSWTVDCGNGTTGSSTCSSRSTPGVTPQTAGISTCDGSYTCSYSSPGTYTITVTVSDNVGDSNSDSVSITINYTGGSTSDTTPPTITSFTANPSTVQVNQSTTLSCSATDNNALSTIEIYKNSTDSTPAKTCTVSGTSASCSTTVTYSVAGTHTAKCISTDTAGNSSSATATVSVTSNPGGSGGSSEDNIPPAILSFTVSPESPLGCVPHNQTITVSCEGEDNQTAFTVYLYVDGNSAPCCQVEGNAGEPATLTRTFTVDWPTGSERNFTCRVVDSWGNDVSSTKLLTSDDPPVILGVSLTNDGKTATCAAEDESPNLDVTVSIVSATGTILASKSCSSGSSANVAVTCSVSSSTPGNKAVCEATDSCRLTTTKETVYTYQNEMHKDYICSGGSLEGYELVNATSKGSATGCKEVDVTTNSISYDNLNAVLETGCPGSYDWYQCKEPSIDTYAWVDVYREANTLQSCDSTNTCTGTIDTTAYYSTTAGCRYTDTASTVHYAAVGDVFTVNRVGTYCDYSCEYDSANDTYYWKDLGCTSGGGGGTPTPGGGVIPGSTTK